MKFQFKTRRSAGVRVTPQVHAHISRGNRARDLRDWSAAASSFEEATRLDPDLYHIWIQLGHSLSEAGRGDDGDAAYARAAALRPERGEPHFHRGHLAKRSGLMREAARHYAEAVIRGDAVEGEAARELEGLVPSIKGLSRQLWPAVLGHPADVAQGIGPGEIAAQLDAILRHGVPAEADDSGALSKARDLLRSIGADEDVPPADAPPFVFDITDLVAHYRRSRLPTGIQRVQIEVISATLREAAGRRIEICCFVDGRSDWIGISRETFLELARLANAGGDVDDPAWQIAKGRLVFRLAVDDPFVVPQDARVLNLGTSWWVHDYFLLVRRAKERARIRFIAFVHDLIPIMVPEHCVRGVTEDFVSWTVGAFQHTDLFLANSHSTRDDLLRVAARLGHEGAADRIEVVPLDADFRRPAMTTLPQAALASWSLGDEPFVLFVSTIESRKNHVLAFDAWARLIASEHGARVPRLVCVGRDGWLNDDAFARLRANPELRARVTIISQVSDAELALLYRSCLFSIYPSHYEGWGLPITESLCYGKVPVIADNSSLPEAGAGFALLFESESVEALVAAVIKAAFDDEWRRGREAEIVAGFAPRPWASVARQIGAAIRSVDDSLADPLDAGREVRPGIYYSTSLYRGTRIWRGLASGEIFRSGDGWLWPETDCCRLRPQGGTLRFRSALADRPLALYLRVAGLADAPCPVAVTQGDATIGQALIEPGDVRWLRADIPAGTGPDMVVGVRGYAAETVRISTGGSDKQFAASVGLVGFLICDAEDEAGRAAFLETLVSGAIEDIGAYRDSGDSRRPALADA